MPNFDPTAFDDLWSVCALAIIVAGIVAMKWIATTKAQVNETSAKMDKVVSTLTENNSGSHVKDQLDRLEAKLGDLDGRLKKLEHPVARRTRRTKTVKVVAPEA